MKSFIFSSGDGNVVLAPVGEKERLGTTLAFIVAGTDAVGIDVPPVGLDLGMHFRITIDFAGGCLEDARVHPLGQTKHVCCPVDAGLDGLHGIVLIVYGGGRAGQIVDLVHFHIEGNADVVAQELKARIVHEFRHIGSGTREKVVHAKDLVARVKQTLAQMGAQKSGPACNQDAFSLCIDLHARP